MEPETLSRRAASAARLGEILEILARDGSLSVGELAARTGMSKATVRRYAEALHRSGRAAWGRCTQAEADRKLCLAPHWRLSTVIVDRTCVRVTDACPATGKTWRQTVSLCDAIPRDEALAAALHTALNARRTETTVGVCARMGVALPMDSLLLEATQIFADEELTRAALAKEYGTKSILYVRYGELPSLRLLAGGIPLPELCAQTALRRAWQESATDRVALLARAVREVLMLLTPDAIVLESDGMRGDAVAERIMATVVDGERPIPPVYVPHESLCEREMLSRLYVRLAEQVLYDAEGE